MQLIYRGRRHDAENFQFSVTSIRPVETPRPGRHVRHGRSSGSRVFTPVAFPAPAGTSGIMTGLADHSCGDSSGFFRTACCAETPDSLFHQPRTGAGTMSRFSLSSPPPARQIAQILTPQRSLIKCANMVTGCRRGKKVKFSSLHPASILHDTACGLSPASSAERFSRRSEYHGNFQLWQYFFRTGNG